METTKKGAHQPGTFNRMLLSCVQRSPLLDPHTLCCVWVVFTNSQKVNWAPLTDHRTCMWQIICTCDNTFCSNVLTSVYIMCDAESSWIKILGTQVKCTIFGRNYSLQAATNSISSLPLGVAMGSTSLRRTPLPLSRQIVWPVSITSVSRQPGIHFGLCNCQAASRKAWSLPEKENRCQSNSTTCADIKHYCILTFHMNCNSAFLKMSERSLKGSLSLCCLRTNLTLSYYIFPFCCTRYMGRDIWYPQKKFEGKKQNFPFAPPIYCRAHTDGSFFSFKKMIWFVKASNFTVQCCMLAEFKLQKNCCKTTW